MNVDELLLNINAVDFDSMVCQTAIQSAEDQKRFSLKGYVIPLTDKEFKEKFNLNPSHIWYTPSLACSSLYFNPNTLAAAPFHMELFLSGLTNQDSLYKAIEHREEEVKNHHYSGSLFSLPDGMRMDYFRLLVNKEGSNLPGLYQLFFSMYLESDYGFSNLDTPTLERIFAAKTPEDQQKTNAVLQNLPDTLHLYRGGNTASTPAEAAYSWSLDINVANFFACRRGYGEGYIAEATVAKKDVIEVFLTERNEKEIIVHPKDIHIQRKIPIKGLDFLKPIITEVAPLYQKYRDRLQDLTFAQDSPEHGRTHEARVLLHCLTLAHVLDLPMRDQKVLATAAIFHDTGRNHDLVDDIHGRASRNYYHDSVSTSDPLVEFLCEYHCLPDEAGYQEIRNNRKLSKNRGRAKRLLEVFKDADALDRVRFGLRDLDLNQLRLPVSKEMGLVARLYLEQVKVPELHKENLKESKNTLSSQIQSAKERAFDSRLTISSKEKVSEIEH